MCTYNYRCMSLYIYIHIYIYIPLPFFPMMACYCYCVQGMQGSLVEPRFTVDFQQFRSFQKGTGLGKPNVSACQPGGLPE